MLHRGGLSFNPKKETSASPCLSTSSRTPDTWIVILIYNKWTSLHPSAIPTPIHFDFQLSLPTVCCLAVACLSTLCLAMPFDADLSSPSFPKLPWQFGDSAPEGPSEPASISNLWSSAVFASMVKRRGGGRPADLHFEGSAWGMGMCDKVCSS
jgi:hypothetical protein